MKKRGEYSFFIIILFCIVIFSAIIFSKQIEELQYFDNYSLNYLDDINSRLNILEYENSKMKKTLCDEGHSFYCEDYGCIIESSSSITVTTIDRDRNDSTNVIPTYTTTTFYYKVNKSEVKNVSRN